MKKLVSVLENLCAALLVVLAFSVFFQILARMVFHIPATWTTEIARAMFHIIVFVGMPIIIYEGSQMTVTMIKDLFAKNRIVTLIFNILGDVVTYFLLITLIYGSYDRTVNEWDAMFPTIPWLSYGHLYLAMLIGAVLMLVAQISCTVKYIKNFSKKEDY